MDQLHNLPLDSWLAHPVMIGVVVTGVETALLGRAAGVIVNALFGGISRRTLLGLGGAVSRMQCRRSGCKVGMSMSMHANVFNMCDNLLVSVFSSQNCEMGRKCDCGRV